MAENFVLAVTVYQASVIYYHFLFKNIQLLPLSCGPDFCHNLELLFL